MSTYTLTCSDIKAQMYTSLIFSEDPLPVEQNCDMLELYKSYQHDELRLWYKDGSKHAVYSPAFDYLYIDSEKQTITLWVDEENRTDDGHKNGFAQIQVTLARSELLHRLEEFFAFDKMVAYEDWL